MAKRSFKSASWTPVAVADAANFTNAGYMALQGGSSTQRTRITEVYCGGQGSASGINAMLLSRDSTVGVTLTSLSTGESDAASDPSTAALAAPVVPFTASTTKPQRSATAGLLNLSFNAFGGIVRWAAAPDGEIWMYGNAAYSGVGTGGEVSLSCFFGVTPGLMGAHIIYETL